MLIVEDHGPGIVDAPRMLQPFERGDASRAQGGAGLGLAIVARIVERHAGKLDIGAVEGGGTRVTVRLPLGFRRVQRNEGSASRVLFFDRGAYRRDRTRQSSAASWARLAERRLPVTRIGVLLTALQVVVRLFDDSARAGQLRIADSSRSFG